MAKASLDSWMSPDHLDKKKMAALRKKFKTAKPFPHLELADFLHPERAALLLKALAGEKFYEKRSDLFKIRQTHDFASTRNPLLLSFREFLRSSEFASYMNAITGVRIRAGKIDVNGSLYQDTDYLLCHDDELDSRCIAFLMYLTDMQKNEGGSLNLFYSKNKKPVSAMKKIIPRFNTFAFFAVSPISFHEVEEMYVDKQRITIGGWLHGNR